MKKLLQKFSRRQEQTLPAAGERTIDRREFFERGLTGAAVITTTWLAADLLYENYGGPLDEEWLDAYYKSDFVGV